MRIEVTASGLSAMAATCSARLSPSQIFATATGAGFPPDVATQMTAIALRESSGCVDAYNPGSANTPESSYGLWQINVKGNPQIMSQLGISDPSQLLDPATNARAAYLLWGGNPANLDVAWYVNRPGYKEAYQSYLPVAQQAAADAGYTPSSIESAPVDVAAGVNVSLDAGAVSWPLVAGIAVAVMLAIVAADL